MCHVCKYYIVPYKNVQIDTNISKQKICTEEKGSIKKITNTIFLKYNITVYLPVATVDKDMGFLIQVYFTLRLARYRFGS